MDPLSVLGGVGAAVGLVDVLWRVGTYLKNVQQSTKNIEGEIEALSNEIKALISVDGAIADLQKGINDIGLPSHPAAANNLWETVEENRQSCKVVLLRLELKLKFIIGANREDIVAARSSSSRDPNRSPLEEAAEVNEEEEEARDEDEKYDVKRNGRVESWSTIPAPTAPSERKKIGKIRSLRQTLRQQSTDPELAKIRQSLHQYNLALLLLMSALNVIYTRGGDKQKGIAIEDLSAKSDINQDELRFRLDYLTSKIDSSNDPSLRHAMKVAGRVAARPLNKHFSIPEAVKSYFTGRRKYLDELTATLDEECAPDGYAAQKRFVIQGLGGSGKTQFCCKFAELNRQRFWGIFYIDASSHETANKSFAAIAERAGLDPNERAGKYWLSSLGPDQPWMLIINNADDRTVNVDNFFPEGEGGFILINTRLKQNRIHGTVGRKWLKFDKLESEEAINLLLRCAGEKRPWSDSTIAVAETIAKLLGFLPLALVHAATTVFNGVCELAGYMAHFQETLQALREKFRKNNKHVETREEDEYLSVYASYEIIYSKLDKDESEGSRDAVELLKLFAFFNREDIRFDALIAAALNPGLELDSETKARLTRRESKLQPSWTIVFRETIFGLRTELLKDRSPPTLPSMLRELHQALTNRNAADAALQKFKRRLRHALNVLEQWSLASLNEERNSYSMHPLIHVWVRRRPQMKLGEQAAWSHAATNTLAQAILLPSGGTLPAKEMEMQRSLLLHITHLRERKREIIAEFSDNVRARTPPLNYLPVLKPTPDTIVKDRYQARQAAKFSYIYFICGRYKDAEVLQEAVRNFLVPNLGLEHETSMRISLFLAKTYWLGGGRFNDAALLTEQVLEAAKRELGDEHETTLGVMDELGNIRNYQGRFPEARMLLEQAVEGRTKVLGPEHRDTLCSIDTLGRIHWTVWAFEKARQHHVRAIEGMEKHPDMGPDHEKTLDAKENLAMAIREIGPAHYEEAHELLLNVVEKRTEILGKEAPWTLLGKSHLAYVKHSMGNHAEAEEIMRTGLVIADRNLGRDHHGVIAARRRFAEILAAQQKYDEAEAIYRSLLNIELYKGGLREDGAVKGDQKDRIYNLYQFVVFWEMQSKYVTALQYCEELCKILTKSVHPIADISRNKLIVLRKLAEQPESPTTSDWWTKYSKAVDNESAANEAKE